jgi:outer membrane protein
MPPVGLRPTAMQSFAPSALCSGRASVGATLRAAQAKAIGLAVVTLVLGALAFPGTAAAQGMKIGVVDVQRAVMQSEDGLRAQASLKKIFDSRQQELTKRQNDLQKQKDDIDRQKNVLSQQALQKKADEWQKEMVELQSTYVEYNKELEKKQKELTDPIFERVLGAIKRIAGTDSYDLIVDRATVAFARGDLDLTDRVIQLSNGGPSAGGAPPPSGGAPAPGPMPTPRLTPPGGPATH